LLGIAAHRVDRSLIAVLRGCQTRSQHHGERYHQHLLHNHHLASVFSSRLEVLAEPLVCLSASATAELLARAAPANAASLHLSFGSKFTMASSTTETSEQSLRRTAHEIFQRVEDSAHDELRRPAMALAFSGFAGGVSMGLTGIAVACSMAALADVPGREFVAYLLYPIGFIAVIIGRAQLFTENTLYPVALILSEKRHVVDTARLWAVVFIFNVLGAIAFAALAIKTDSLSPSVSSQLIELGRQASVGGVGHIFWSGVIGGWIIALVAWMVTASHWTIGQIAVIWLLTFVVGVGHFAHCIASSGEIMSAVFAGAVPLSRYLWWLLIATSGNILGGVLIVTLLNFGQVKAGELD
jgi:formate/nitrite transporter FocA (FNT family)